MVVYCYNSIFNKCAHCLITPSLIDSVAVSKCLAVHLTLFQAGANRFQIDEECVLIISCLLYTSDAADE